jgi:hypothetical protein
MTRYLLLFDSYDLFFCGVPSLTRGQVWLWHMLRYRLLLYRLRTDNTENKASISDEACLPLIAYQQTLCCVLVCCGDVYRPVA